MTQPTSNLSQDQQGKEVALLHSHLFDIGYKFSPSEVQNEVFGPSTEQAVR
jgi:hypothetical protein